jgi:disintegrin and metalloproteinase domain-containing protein 10
LFLDHLLQHDQDSSEANGIACAPGGVYGNYIMYAYANDGSKPNNNAFSECSKVIMGNLIRSKGEDCLTSLRVSYLFFL